MKYSCELIQDLLPLYLDGVCSNESKAVIEQHLLECSACKEYYAAMRETNKLAAASHDEAQERQKAASFQAVKKRLLRKQVLITAASIIFLMLLAFIAASTLRRCVNIVDYKNNISVSMVDGSLIGRLQGSQETYLKMKQVSVSENGQQENYLFFYVSETKWDSLTTSSQVFSEYTLCPADKGADQIDYVYYYTGDYTGIESMSQEALRQVINEAVLLWSK